MAEALPIGWAYSSLLLSLRISPVFALAPPFSLTQVPTLFRAFFGLVLAACMVLAFPARTALPDLGLGAVAAVAVRELMLGSIFVLAFQLMFAALYIAGRTLDIQAGFGLALLIDPATRTQTPLIGTLFVYAAAAIFFAMDGHAELLRILAASLEAIPLGAARFPETAAPMIGFLSTMTVAAFGAAGGAILCLFLADISIAVLSRTVPQMNVLILGLQVKVLLLLLVLPLTFGVAGALLARMVRITLETLPRLIR